LGRVLQTCPGPKTLPTSRRLDPAANLVASVPTLAQRRLETAARDQVVRRVRACTVDRFNSFSRIPASLSLRESCMHETCTCSLRGGRRPARKRASSDPTETPSFRSGIQLAHSNSPHPAFRIVNRKVLRYPQAWFVESAHGDGDAQAAGEADGAVITPHEIMVRAIHSLASSVR